uniref:Integrator complex subunit 7 n=1 Tax=Timema poppense TaxID=170557 RepID=A0A7R9H6J2_TIMPO|nr:unnamed protein product [Timema poppensis]
MLGNVRVNSFSENGLGEPEQDANSALTELDKGLRSGKVGEQCEAIVRFPRLFEKYPFPILINSSLLKLADVFRVGNNFLRVWVLCVCQQSEKHLDKILNVDEFVRRIFSVIHSNDPIARALTLRTLGSVAGIIPERQQVHHSIRRSLDSHDAVEVEAAISAATQFAAQSRTFAVSMCNKFSDMIRGLSTPAPMKLQLIPILQHMHHDTSTAAMVRELCTDLLPSYPARDFVLVTLNALTQLASATLVDVPKQVSLLLQYLRTDPHWEVKAQALKNLHYLAGQGAHLWPTGAVEAIVEVAMNTSHQKILRWSLDDLCPRFVDLIGSQLEMSSDMYSTFLCEALGAIGGIQSQALHNLLPKVLDKLRSSETLESHTKVMLCILVFQSFAGYEWNIEAKRVIEGVVKKNNLWANYRIARSGARYGHHAVSASILNQLKDRVSSEHLHFWLAALEDLSHGEAELIDISKQPLLTYRLRQAIVHYNKAFAALKAASTPTHGLQFQCEYVRLRAEFLQCLCQLAYSCNSLCTAPPPAVASSLAENTRDPLQRYGHATNQLRKCVKEFRACAELYWKLYQSAFDADPASLVNIQLLQQMCLLLAHSVEKVAQSTYQEEAPLDFSLQHSSLETQHLIRCCQEASAVADRLSIDQEPNSITHQHIDCLLRQIEILSGSSLCLPRYFFQVLQSTSVKLAISPQPRVLGEPIGVQSGYHLAVKVEGVIQHGKRPGLFRSISGVVITVSSQLQSRSGHAHADTKPTDPSSLLTHTVAPHRDFFTAQFLLAFPTGGQYLLSVEASVVDERSNVWRTGPRTTLAVKSHEEMGKSTAGTSRGGFGSWPQSDKKTSPDVSTRIGLF